MPDQKAKILCVEDEKDIRENIAEILRDEGFEVFEADNGKTGFESFIKNSPDLIISDIMMPEVDGYAFLQLIRESKNIRNNNVPFIFLTALGQKDNLIKGVNLSANDYLLKPIDFDLMIAKIKEKVTNSGRVQEVNKRNISNIKSQISVVLPSEIFSYLDIISQTISNLKEEPYGKLPHRRYIEDFDIIYLNSLKLRGVVSNALDHDVIDSKININEEIISISNFFEDFISNFSEKLKNKIIFEKPLDYETLPRLKIDRFVLVEALKKIFAGMLRADPASSLQISILTDHRDNIVLIFYLDSEKKDLDLNLTVDEAQVGKILDAQNCRFEIVENKSLSSCLTIPSYRLVK